MLFSIPAAITKVTNIKVTLLSNAHGLYNNRTVMENQTYWHFTFVFSPDIIVIMVFLNQPVIQNLLMYHSMLL